MTPQPVYILGAGISGLALGRCLKSKGIPAILFEKGESPPRHNYGITLHSWAYKPFLKTLDIDESTFRHQLAVDTNKGGNGHIFKVSNSASFRAHCGRFESMLREDLNIKWGHQYEHSTPNGAGRTLSFKNQNQVSSNLAIDTCGVHSRTRKQLSNESQLKVLPYVVFRGTRRIPGNHFKETYAPFFKDATMIETRNSDTIFQISIDGYQKDSEIVDINYVYSRPARLNDDPLHRPGREKDEASKINEEFYQEVSGLKDIESPFKETFDVQSMREDRILHWLMRSSITPLSELKELAETGFVMLGDSSHALPILGGNGANEAIWDGMELAEYIDTHGTEGISGFYDQRHDAWQKSVKEAEKRLADMHSQGKSSL